MMDAYIEPQMKAVSDFHDRKPKNNTYTPGTMCHRLYEEAWLRCVDSVIRQAARNQDEFNDIRESVA